jgi:hypothetical protein
MVIPITTMTTIQTAQRVGSQSSNERRFMTHRVNPGFPERQRACVQVARRTAPLRSPQNLWKTVYLLLPGLIFIPNKFYRQGGRMLAAPFDSALATSGRAFKAVW